MLYVMTTNPIKTAMPVFVAFDAHAGTLVFPGRWEWLAFRCCHSRIVLWDSMVKRNIRQCHNGSAERKYTLVFSDDHVYMLSIKAKKINFISLSFGFHILLDQFKQLWNSEIYNSSKGINNRIFKTTLSFEKYLFDLPSKYQNFFLVL